MPRSSREEAAVTRGAILERTLELGSLVGLENLSVGRLADDLGMSKAGVIGPFGSKEALQLAALEAALDSFREHVWEPARHAEHGLPRLRALADAWIDYLENRVFAGGCFLSAVSLEFDDRPGSVRDALADAMGLWRSVIEAEARAAIDAGDLPGGRPPEQVAFELGALVIGTNAAHRLQRDPAVFERARAALDRLIPAPQAAAASS